MIKILMVCHGNICRSPMAEFVMKDLVNKAGRQAEFAIESCAMRNDELGNPVYPPARRMLASHGIDCSGKTARKITRDDYRNFDLLVCMDQENLWDLERWFPGDPDGKISLLMAYAGRHRDVADPWYTGNFQDTWDDVLEGCTALLQKLTENAS